MTCMHIVIQRDTAPQHQTCTAQTRACNYSFGCNRDELVEVQGMRHTGTASRTRHTRSIDRAWTCMHGSRKHKARTRVHACRVRAASVHVNRPCRPHPHRPILMHRSPLVRHRYYSLHNCMSIWQFCACHMALRHNN